jgi:hypothetical protein
MSSSALVRAQIQARLPSAFAQRAFVETRTMPTGVSPIDDAIGGIPCGGITEIVGCSWCSTGRKSVQAQLLRCATRDHFCALVDATDSFDPRSAKTAGVNLERLLWIRVGARGVKALEQAFKASDLLLQGSGGFGLIVVDLAGISERLIRKVPLSTWFRFRSVVEKLPGSLVFMTPSPTLGTCASLTLTLSARKIQWSLPTPGSPAHGRLPAGLDFHVEVSTRRSFKKSSQPIRSFSAQRRWA